MRKWLVLLLALAILYALPKINTRGSRRKFPLMKRIDDTVNVLAAVLLSESLLRSGYKHPLLLGGTIAFVLAHLFNSLDSTVPNLPWAASVEAVGALAVLAFSLLGLAFLGYRQEGKA